MNQQTLIAVQRAYPVLMPTDNLARLDEASLFQRHTREMSDGEEVCARAAMAKNLEKILSITRLSWAASYADKKLPGRTRR